MADHAHPRLVRRLALAVAIAAGTLSAAAGAQGKTFHVAPDGNDANAGTGARPFRTVAKGVGDLKAGDTLYLKAGTYRESLMDAVPGGTSWEAPVTVAAVPGDRVTISAAPGATEVFHFAARSRAYIVIKGLVLDGRGRVKNVVKITYTTGAVGSSHHIRLEDCEVKDSGGQGILVSGPAAHANEFLNLHVHHNGRGSKYAHGFYVETDQNRIEGCRCHDNGGHGIQVYCTGDAARKPGRYLPDGNVVRNCRVYRNGTRGIGLYSGVGNSAYNNVVWGNDGGILVTSAGAKVYHNTVWNNAGYGIRLQAVKDVAVRNNIVAGNTGAGIAVDAQSAPGPISGNLLFRNGARDYAHESGRALPAGNLTGRDPGLVDAPGGDFRLRADSPAIGAGEAVREVPADLEGVKRPRGKAVHLGAYEFRRRGTAGQ